MVANSRASNPSRGMSSIIDGSNTPSSISSVKTLSASLSKVIDCDVSSKGVPSLRYRIILFPLVLSLGDFLNQQIRPNPQNNTPADNYPRLDIDSRFRAVNRFFGFGGFGDG